jgi:hypothetical protein
MLNFICWIFLVLTLARRLSRTDSQAGGGFTCLVRMRAFVPFLLSSCYSLLLTLLYLLGLLGAWYSC